MNTVSSDVAKQFCELCNWAYECWVSHKLLFDQNKEPETNIGKAKHFTARLSVITQEYCLLQICKLHDPAIQRSSLNLSVEYIVRFGDWRADTVRIKSYVQRLTDLFEKIKSARNKLLAHNDLEAMNESAALGAFPVGLDSEYFSVLQELVNAVSEKWLGGPHPFNDLAKVDVEEFLRVLERSNPRD